MADVFFRICEYVRTQLPEEDTTDIMKNVLISDDGTGKLKLEQWNYPFAQPKLKDLPSLSQEDVKRNLNRQLRDMSREKLNADNIQNKLIKAVYELFGGPDLTGKNFNGFALDVINNNQ